MPTALIGLTIRSMHGHENQLASFLGRVREQRARAEEVTQSSARHLLGQETQDCEATLSKRRLFLVKSDQKAIVQIGDGGSTSKIRALKEQGWDPIGPAAGFEFFVFDEQS